MATPDIWVAKDDGSDIIRTSAIAAVGRDYNGNITARLSGVEQAVVTLVAETAHTGPPTPEDFHLQLIRLIAELSGASEPVIVRPGHDERQGWKWRAGPL
ncbi:MAG TPA: hypothetical protein VH637_05305 [Streptosporangiaceae bacterium]|jgi:hypothetical protein